MSFDNGLDAHQQAKVDYEYEQLMKKVNKIDPGYYAQMMKEIDLINNKTYSEKEITKDNDSQLSLL